MDEATLRLALEMDHMNASLLPSSSTDNASRRISSTPSAGARAAANMAPVDCGRDYRPTETPGVSAPHPHLLGLGLQYSSADASSSSSASQTTNPAVDSDDALPERIEERLRTLLGEPLSDVDRANVQLAPFRSCLPGEIVAVEDMNNTLRYAKVMEEEDDASSSAEVKVQISKYCIRWYPVSQLYFFWSSGTAHGQEDSSANQLTGHFPASVAKSTKGSQLADVDATQAGSSVSSVIETVNGLLARVNVSLSTSYEELLAEILRLQHHAALAEEDRREALKQMEHAMREKRDAEKALVCVVCLVNPVDRVLVPCGHSYCAACVHRLRHGSCPVCRQEVSDSATFRVP